MFEPIEPEESEYAMPVCRHHKLPILKCDNCCERIRVEGPRGDADKLHAWAIKEIY